MMEVNINQAKMKVLYFGTYSTGPGYPRNRVIIQGLKLNGVVVIECHKEIWKGADEKLKVAGNFFNLLKFAFNFFSAYIYLVIQFFKIKDYDLIIVGYAGHIDIFLARLLNLFKSKPIVFDAFLSLYDTVVLDRKLTSVRSVKAKLLWMLDRYSCKMADLVTLDTNAHINFFVNEFHLNRTLFRRVLVGDEKTNLSLPPFSTPFIKPDHFNILFFGTYIPLHGIEYIIEAAKLLQHQPDISFTLIGKGALLEDMKTMAENLKIYNIHFITELVPYPELLKYIDKADLCLGIFGNTPKAQRVIPCKVYHCMKMGKAILTGNSPGAREILTHGKNAFLCKQASGKDIAEAIMELKNSDSLRKDLQTNIISTFQTLASSKAIGKKLIEDLKIFFSLYDK